MLRSLSSAVTGLQNTQTEMDVIGNNIANVNTIGYKSGRVTFAESFSQLVAGATRASDGSGGGTNPLQVGLGMSVGSIDTQTSQGDLESTGNTLDLAISGNAFFGVSDGKATYYTRNGSFQLDSSGNVVLPTNGMILQGKMADSEGNFPTGTTIGNVTIPFNEQSPAKSTTTVDYSRNLNADSTAQGTVTYSQTWLHAAGADSAAGEPDSINALYNSTGGSLGIQTGDKITIAYSSGGTLYSQTYTAGTDFTTVDGLVNAMDTQLAPNGGGATLDPTGAIAITVGGAEIDNLQVTSNNPLSNPYLNKAMNVPSKLLAGGGPYLTDALRGVAYGGDQTTNTPGDLVSSLFDANGNSLGLETGDQINVTAMVGTDSLNSADAASGVGPISYDSTTTTLDQILTQVRDTLKLPLKDGTVLNNPSVSIDAGNTDDEIPDGTMVVRGAKGTAFAITNLTISATNSNNTDPAPTDFNANLAFTQKQKAQDVGSYDTSISVYDETGAEHTLTTTFTHTDTPGVWDWTAKFNGSESILKGGAGQVTFGQDGSVASFTYNDNSSQLTMDPNNGSNQLKLNLDVGGPGNFQGLTQFSSATTASATKQDGYATGNLQSISVDANGFVDGAFSNVTTHHLAQIQLVDFTNPGGLTRLSDSVYTTSANSGDAIYGAPGSQSSSTLQPGALEMSNVDLANQFTNMITTQRAYQANARVITTTDSMLQELVDLKRS